MVNVVNGNPCGSLGCNTSASYNFTGLKPKFCTIHKEEGMILTYGSYCTYSGCNTRAIFGTPGHRPVRCAKHMDPIMTDLNSRRCSDSECTNRSLYGVPGSQTMRCSLHKLPGDIAYPRSSCTDASCKNLSIFGSHKPLRCEVHRVPSDFNLVHRKCGSCSLFDVLDDNDHCYACDPTTFANVRLANQKETKVYFDTHGVVYTSYDKVLDRAVCGLERPDFVHPAPHGLITEVDEQQHRGYPCECESARMINVTGAMGLPSLFIRYNPHKYKTASGEQWPIKKRLAELVNVIKYWQNHPLPSGGQTFVIYMFYDGEDYNSWLKPQLVL
jgi:hypothetical protein